MNITTHILADWPEPRKKRMAKPWTITKRRKEVLYWLARGKSTQDIADILGLSFFTTKNHVLHIYKIYGTPNRICAVLRAIARGDISLDEILREFA
ncbi:MAG TPA: helix-turn-helix transcriptional regulator [Candidatus Binatia bacterium]|nr:helix-turn-helix transcriptional regulator [Candidatus Binatia bacterium]